MTVTHAGSQPIGVIALGQWRSNEFYGVRDAYGFVPGIQFNSISEFSYELMYMIYYGIYKIYVKVKRSIMEGL